MKKTLLIIAVCLIASSTAFSQVQFGVGATAATKTGWDDNGEFKMNFGANARVLWDFSEKFALSGGFSYFLPSKITVLDHDFTYKYMSVNADAIYYLMDNNDVKVYGLGGLNYGFVDFDIAGFEGADDGISWEVGGGVMFGKFFVEAKYDANLEQIQGFVGIYL